MKRPMIYAWFVVLLIVSALITGYKIRQSVIEEAKVKCGSFHSSQQEEPYNMKVKLLACQNAQTEQKRSWCWSVSMDGSWLVQGPPAEGGVPSMPEPFYHCETLFDAFTGMSATSLNK
jgi:cytochrome bd-type quinol oxidase subunit 1